MLHHSHFDFSPLISCWSFLCCNWYLFLLVLLLYTARWIWLCLYDPNLEDQLTNSLDYDNHCYYNLDEEIMFIHRLCANSLKLHSSIWPLGERCKASKYSGCLNFFISNLIPFKSLNFRKSLFFFPLKMKLFYRRGFYLKWCDTDDGETIVIDQGELQLSKGTLINSPVSCGWVRQQLLKK